MMKQKYEKKGQGAVEYLLLLAAAIVVVALVIAFLGGLMPTVTNEGNRQLYDNICGTQAIFTTDNNSLLCGCFLKDPKLGDKNASGIVIMASTATCPERLPTQYANDPLLDWQ